MDTVCKWRALQRGRKGWMCCVVGENTGGGGVVAVECVFLSFFLFISFMFVEFGFCGPFQAKIVRKGPR